MSDVGQRERPVQDRVVLLFADRLGYRYLGNRQYRPGNSNIEQEDLRAWLRKQGTSETLIDRALRVDKLLTGFDAPPATYLYIDKKMQNHGLFQAICRVNRLDGEDKEYGYIIDYKDLFNSLEGAVADYTGEALDGYDEEDVAGLLKNRLEMGRERLEETRETVRPVRTGTPAAQHYRLHPLLLRRRHSRQGCRQR